MRTKENILEHLAKSTHDFKETMICEVERILKFYELHPKYEDVTPEEVFFIMFSAKRTPGGIKVYDFGDGIVGFVGYAFDETDAPIAGNFPIIPPKKSFAVFLNDYNPIERIQCNY